MHENTVRKTAWSERSEHEMQDSVAPPVSGEPVSNPQGPGPGEVTAPVEPNFLYIGTSKAGSTWLFAVLAEHPDVFVEPGKGVYFFTAKYSKGVDWYREQFHGVSGETAIGELSHSYLYSAEAPGRIAAMNPEMKLLVCLREPAERAFSDYLHKVKNGKINVSFEEAVHQVPSIVERGKYHKYLKPYIERFGRDAVHVGVFDELRSDPDLFVSRVFDFLEVENREVPPHLRKKIMPAGDPRSFTIAQAAKKVASFMRWMGLRSVVGTVKRSPQIRYVLYRPYQNGERPEMRPETRESLRQTFAPEIRQLDKLLGTDFQGLWGY
jgi:hypothetical protein